MDINRRRALTTQPQPLPSTLPVSQQRFLFIFVLFKLTFYRKNVGFSGIRTWIIRVEGEHADHLTTTTTRFKTVFVPIFCISEKSLSLNHSQMMNGQNSRSHKLGRYNANSANNISPMSQSSNALMPFGETSHCENIKTIR